MIPALGDVFGKASKAIGRVAGELGGGPPAGATLKQRFEPVKDALDAVSSIAGHSRVSVGVKVQGDGPNVTATATITVTF
jgi:hypothetical protein